MRTIKILLLLVLLLPATGCNRIAAFFNGGREYSKKLVCHIDRSKMEGDLVFSPDGRHLAYATNSSVVVDGKEGTPQGTIIVGSLYFSPDSRRLAYETYLGGRSTGIVVTDGIDEKHYDSYSRAYFSPNSRREVHLAERDYEGKKGGAVVVDGREGEFHQGHLMDTKLSPDGQHVAFVTSWWPCCAMAVVVDDKEEKPYDGMEYVDSAGDNVGVRSSTLTFSPDSQRLAYVAAYNIEDGYRVVEVHGNEGKPYIDIIGAPIFSPDSRHLAYVATIDRKVIVSEFGKAAAVVEQKEILVVDGNEGKPYFKIAKGSVVFSPDSRRTAFWAQVGVKWVAVEDGKEGKAYDTIDEESLTFSPDSQHLAYEATVGNKWTVVVDGKEGKRFDLIPGKIVFDSSTRLHYLANKDSAGHGEGYDVYLVEETIH